MATLGDGLSACLLLLVTVSGCARFDARPLDASASLDAFESRSLDPPELLEYLRTHVPTGEVAPDTWNLTSLTLAAFFFHPDLEVARAQYATAQGELIIAGELPNPSISLAPGFNYNTPSTAPISSWIMDVALHLPVETSGKRDYRISHAGQISEAARLNIAVVAWQVRERVRQALLDLYAARELETQLLRHQEIQSENVRLLEVQLDAGSVSPFEVIQARIPLNATRVAVAEAQIKQARAQIRLSAAIGVPVAALDGIVFSFDAFTGVPRTMSTEQVRRLALLNRPDILAGIAEYQASQSALQLEIAKQNPDIEFGPGYTFDQSDNEWTFGLSMVLPILNQNQGAIAAAEGRRAEAAARFTALQAAILAQIDEAVAAYEGALRKLDTTRILAGELQHKATATRRIYETGEILKLEVVAANLEVTTNELSQLDARIEVLQALGGIENAVQQPTDLPEWQTLVSQDDNDSTGNAI